MPQFLTDFWNALDWPNIIVSAIVAILLGYLATKIYPMWVKSRDTSKIILNNRTKSSIKRDLRIVLRMQSDPNYMTIWCAQRLIIIFVFGLFGLCMLVLFGVYVLSDLSGVSEIVPVSGSVLINLIIGFFVVPMSLMFLEVMRI